MVGQPEVVRKLLHTIAAKEHGLRCARCFVHEGGGRAEGTPRHRLLRVGSERLLGRLALRELKQRLSLSAVERSVCTGTPHQGVVYGQLRARPQARVRVQAFRRRERQLEHLGVVAPVKLSGAEQA
eukprot:scaffold94526_cov63-Phaeocystis_antarctica.AAC.4